MKKKTKRIILSLCLVVLFGGIGSGYFIYNNLERFLPPMLIPPAYFWIDKDKPLEEQTAIVSIADREFKIPMMYINSRIKNGRKEGSIVLVYVLPDFTSRLQYSDTDERRKVFKERRFAHMLLEAAEDRPPIEVSFNNLERGNEISRNEDFDGLENYNWHREQQNKLVFVQQVFLEKDNDGKVISYIKCGTSQTVKSPGCEHRFIDKGVLYQIYYNKAKYLDSWREQRQKAIEFINSFEIQPSNASEKEIQ